MMARQAANKRRTGRGAASSMGCVRKMMNERLQKSQKSTADLLEHHVRSLKILHKIY